MLNHRDSLTTHSFRHISRSLKEGEALPKLPSLIEQVLACHFAAPLDEEAAVDEEYADADFAEFGWRGK